MIDIGDAVMSFLGDGSQIDASLKRIEAITRSATGNMAASARQATGAFNEIGDGLQGSIPKIQATIRELTRLKSALEAKNRGAYTMGTETKAIAEVNAQLKAAYQSLTRTIDEESRKQHAISQRSAADIKATFGQQITQSLKMSLDPSHLISGAIGGFVGGAVYAAFTSSINLMTQAFQGLTSAGIDFERAFANVRTLLVGTNVDAMALQHGISNLSPSLGTATELSKGLYEVISAGINAGESVNVTAEAAKFAKAGLMDMTTAVRALTMTLNAYSLTTRDVTEVSDVLFTTVNLGVVTGQELAQAFGAITPIAATLGVPLRETTALLAALTRGGLSFSEAVTSLRQTMVNFLGPSTEAKQLARDLGVELSQDAVKSKGFTKALFDLAVASKGSGQAMDTFFGNVRALTGVLALTGKQAGIYSTILGQMNNTAFTAGATQNAFAIQMATVGGQLERTGNIFVRFGENLGYSSGFLRMMITDFNDLLETISKHSRIDIEFRMIPANAKDVLSLAADELERIKALSFVSPATSGLQEAVLSEGAAKGELNRLQSIRSSTLEISQAFDTWRAAAALVRSELDKLKPIKGAPPAAFTVDASSLDLLKGTTELSPGQKAYQKEIEAKLNARIAIERKWQKEIDKATGELAGQIKPLDEMIAKLTRARDEELKIYDERKRQAAMKESGLPTLESVEDLAKRWNAIRLYVNELVRMRAPAYDIAVATDAMRVAWEKFNGAIESTEERIARILKQARSTPVALAPPQVSPWDALKAPIGKDLSDTSPLMRQSAAIKTIEDAFRLLGVTSAQEWQSIVKAAEEAFERIKRSGLSSTDDIMAAEVSLSKARIELAQATGKAISKEDKDRVRVFEEQNKKMEKRSGGVDWTRSWGDVWKKNTGELVTWGDIGINVLDGMTAAVTQSLMAWMTGTASFGEAMKQMTLQLLTNLAMQAAVESLMNLAKGYAAAANPFTAWQAPMYFAAAKTFGIVAGMAGAGAVGMAAAGGGMGSGGGSASSASDKEYQRAAPQPVQGNVGGQRNYTQQAAQSVAQSFHQMAAASQQQMAASYRMATQQTATIAGAQTVIKVNINAIDSKSFEQVMKQSGRNPVLEIVKDNIASNGDIRRMLKKSPV